MEQIKKIIVNDKVVAINNYTVQEVVEPAKYTIEIRRDESADFPDNEAVELYSNHRNYTLDGNIDEILTDGKIPDDDEQYAYKKIYAINHSGIHLLKQPGAGDYWRWDGGLFAIARIDKTKVNDVDKAFDSSFVQMRAYFDGDIYYYVVRNEVGDIVDNLYGLLLADYDKFISYVLDCVPDKYGITRADVEYALQHVCDY